MKIEAPRFDRLDALRGFAMVWMALFHFAFDLNHFGVLVPRQHFNIDPFWTTQRTAIVSLFLFCAGLGQAIAVAQGQEWPRFWRRWTQVAVCAVLVSIGSWWMFPRSYISFGVLHAIAVMLILLRVGAPLGRWWFLIGAVALVLPHLVQHPFFDTRATNWVGLVTRRPLTEDYVPLLPWIGVMGWGYAAGREILRARRHWIDAGLPRALKPLAALGRWPLSFYMLHQPVLIGLVMAFVALSR
jgi:uncharacterized membrane protein